MNFEILQPKPYDLVGRTILIAGNAVGFESHLSLAVTDGHDEVTGTATAGSVEIRQFQGSIAIPASAAFQLDRLFLTVADDSGGGEGGAPSVTAPVLFGPMILPGYTGCWNHTVVAGDTLTKLAKHYFEGDATKVTVIQQANQHVVTNPDLIFVGQVLRIPRAF